MTRTTTRIATASVAITALVGLSLWPNAAQAAAPSYVDESSVDALALAVAADRQTYGGVSVDEATGILTVRYDDAAGLGAAQSKLRSYTAPWHAPASTVDNRIVAPRGATQPKGQSSGRQYKLVLTEVTHSLSELDAVRSKLSTFAPGVVSEKYVDVPHNRVALGVTRLTPELTAAAQRTFGDVVSLHEAARPARAFSSRVDDFEPWTAGIRIWSPTSGCSSGFFIRNLNTTQKRMVTAGHCGPVGTPWTNNGDPVGTTVVRNFTDGGFDVSYIGGRTYEAWSYVGGPVSEVGQWITGTYLSLVGRQFCTNGATSGEVCTGTVSAIDACITFSDGIETCFLDIMNASGVTLVRPGDSGGPVINTPAVDPTSIKIGGIIIGNGQSGSYFHSYHYLIPSGWTFDHV